jgi:hypothetical protein
MGIRHALRYAWAAPATAAGMLLALPALALGARARVVRGAVEVGGGWLERGMLGLPGPYRFGAITFGHVIIGINDSVLASCRDHEHVHVRQYERWGPLFFPLYLGSSLVQLARGRDPYLDNHFEREAYGKAPRR